MAKVFGVSRSGFYYWIDNRHKVTQRNEQRKQLDSKVREVFDDKKERDGARRIQKELEENGNKHNVKTIALACAVLLDNTQKKSPLSELLNGDSLFMALTYFFFLAATFFAAFLATFFASAFFAAFLATFFASAFFAAFLASFFASAFFASAFFATFLASFFASTFLDSFLAILISLNRTCVLKLLSTD